MRRHAIIIFRYTLGFSTLVALSVIKSVLHVLSEFLPGLFVDENVFILVEVEKDESSIFFSLHGC